MTPDGRAKSRNTRHASRFHEPVRLGQFVTVTIRSGAAREVGGDLDGLHNEMAQSSSRSDTVRREYRRLSPTRRRTETGSLVARPWPRRLWGLHMAQPRHEREG